MMELFIGKFAGEFPILTMTYKEEVLARLKIEKESTPGKILDWILDTSEGYETPPGKIIWEVLLEVKNLTQ